MKNLRTSTILAVMACALAAGHAHAAVHTLSGKLGHVRTHNLDIVAGEDWLALADKPTIGSCRATPDGLITPLLLPNGTQGDRLLSLGMSAVATGADVRIIVDDELKNPAGYCWLRLIQMDATH